MSKFSGCPDYPVSEQNGVGCILSVYVANLNARMYLDLITKSSSILPGFCAIYKMKFVFDKYLLTVPIWDKCNIALTCPSKSHCRRTQNRVK